MLDSGSNQRDPKMAGYLMLEVILLGQEDCWAVIFQKRIKYWFDSWSY